MKGILDLIREICDKHQRVAVLCHENADVDAVASAIVFSEILNSLGARSWAGCESLSKLAEHALSVAGRLNSISLDPPLDADYFLLVDTSSLDHLGKKLAERVRGRRTIMIDHHREVEEATREMVAAYIDDTLTSESELVFMVSRELGVNLSPDQCTLLLAGVLTDTAELRLAKNKTFETIYELINRGADFRKAQEMVKLPEERSRKIAMIKAAKRADMYEIRGYLVLLSEVGSFEADAAVALLKLGADLAFVGSRNENTVKISARARPEVCEQTRLHLGDLMIELSRTFGGNGGGHAGAASFTGSCSLEEVRGWIVNRLYEYLGPKIS